MPKIVFVLIMLIATNYVIGCNLWVMLKKNRPGFGLSISRTTFLYSAFQIAIATFWMMLAIAAMLNDSNYPIVVEVGLIVLAHLAFVRFCLLRKCVT
ncbi:MAG: hypothetical protein PHP62_03635 [Candidatus Moranbacteria bacterium]|nr:hypothetical protein [Candidatus Moranbacteria bacterium]